MTGFQPQSTEKRVHDAIGKSGAIILSLAKLTFKYKTMDQPLGWAATASFLVFISMATWLQSWPGGAVGMWDVASCVQTPGSLGLTCLGGT